MSAFARTRWMLAASAALLVTSCGGAAHSSDSPGQGGGATLVGKVQSTKLGSLTPQDVGAAQTAFGLDLLARRCTAHPDANDVLSPASAALALSMLDAGARGGAAAALSKLLHVPAWSPDLVAALHAQTSALRALKQLEVSNRLYTQAGIRPQQGVLDDLATAFGAGLQTLNFSHDPVQATAVINGHVKTDTHGLIPKLFDSPLDVSTTTVLTNALYLYAKWTKPFVSTFNGTFNTAKGSPVTTSMMMSAEGFGQLRKVGDWQSVSLQYAGGKLEAVVLLPASRTAQSCQAPTAQQVRALTSGAAGEVSIDMPKLNLSQTTELARDLSALGMQTGGDYSGFGTSGSISQIAQKTVLQVDEHGTKAAAATGISVGVSAGPSVTVDRPYLLLIRDTTTGAPLFFARISDPTATG